MAAEAREEMSYVEFGKSNAGPIFTAYVDIARFLQLNSEETLQLLGGLSSATYGRYLYEGATDLSGEMVERISLVLGITKAFAASLFGGRSLPAMATWPEWRRSF